MTATFQVLLLLLTVAVIFVNGWTDAPNAIASAVATGALPYRKAVALAAVCNLLGTLVMGLVSTSVAETMLAIARFDGASPRQALAAICAAMLSIVLFAVAAWGFGIPTSESHALIAALTGAAFALGGAASVDAAAWRKVLWGLALSVALGLALGWLLARVLGAPLRRCGERRLAMLQTAAAGGMAFMHGAQDGQKFVAVLVGVDLLGRGGGAGGGIHPREHWLALCLCAVVMALGTSVGGGRIIETVGGKMARLDKAQGVCADLAGALCLLAASLPGIPMSTTHTKTTAIMGAGAARGRGAVDAGVIRGMFGAWLVTFPACFVLGFALTKLFVRLAA